MLEQPSGQQAAGPAQPQGSNRKWIVLGIAGCALIACVGIVVLVGISILAPQITYEFNRLVSGVSNTASVPPTPEVSTYPQQPSNTLGNPNAPVKIVEYADFQCPFCRQYWQDIEPQIIDQYVKTGKVFYEYRSVGEFLGPESAAAAQAAYCAGDQGKFWQYHDTLFSNLTGENVGDFTNDKLQQYAATVGLDETAFNDCLSSGKYAARLQQDVQDAKAAGVKATPSLVVNGKLIEGLLSFDAYQKAIDAALQSP